MKRHRNLSSNGGCIRKTVSLPADLVRRVEEYVARRPGMTISAFVSDTLDAHLPSDGKTKP